VTIARKKCESRAIDCDQFVISALEFFPGDAELQNSTRRFPDSDARALGPQEEKLSFQVEAALRNRRYVLPPQESAVYFANEIQRTAPGYGRALDVKRIAREETDKEIEQLTRTLQESRALRTLKEADSVLIDFGRARSLLAAKLKFWPDDTRARRQFDDLRNRIQEMVVE